MTHLLLLNFTQDWLSILSNDSPTFYPFAWSDFLQQTSSSFIVIYFFLALEKPACCRLRASFWASFCACAKSANQWKKCFPRPLNWQLRMRIFKSFFFFSFLFLFIFLVVVVVVCFENKLYPIPSANNPAHFLQSICFIFYWVFEGNWLPLVVV